MSRKTLCAPLSSLEMQSMLYSNEPPSAFTKLHRSQSLWDSVCHCAVCVSETICSPLSIEPCSIEDGSLPSQTLYCVDSWHRSFFHMLGSLYSITLCGDTCLANHWRYDPEPACITANSVRQANLTMFCDIIFIVQDLSHLFGGGYQVKFIKNGMRSAFLPNKRIGNLNKKEIYYLNMFSFLDCLFSSGGTECLLYDCLI